MKQRLVAFLILWIPLVLVGLGLGATVEFLRARDALQREATTLHRVISQRVDQHDAHLTSLAAVLASSSKESDTLRAVIEALQRFYPRVAGVEMLAFDASSAALLGEAPPGLRGFDLPALAKRIVDLAPGQATILASQKGTPFYALVKRLPDSGSRLRALVLVIDARLLTEPEGGLPDGVGLALRDAAGTTIVERGWPLQERGAIPALSFEKALASRSQPLLLQLARQPRLAELLPPGLVIGLPLAAGLGIFLLLTILRERRASAGARAAMRLHQHDARLAHAMRVNMAGEMASGIAHEITQPLTAILSQSQAGLRLARSGAATSDELVGVLEANVRHARRAGEILERLRVYVTRREPHQQPVDLNGIIRNVVALTQRDLQEREIVLRLDLSPDAPQAMLDRVSIEQVVHNLLRNAAEAVETQPAKRRAIVLATRAAGTEVEISVADEGGGISDADMMRLFEPFFTTKSSGMGLGLPLCERLIEAAGGRITARNGTERGAVFTIRLPALVAEPRIAAE